MKLSQLLRHNKEWAELFKFAHELMITGEKTHSPATYYAGLRLSQLLGKLSEVEIDVNESSKLERCGVEILEG